MAPSATEQVEYEVDPDLQERLLEHPGKWVAIAGNDIVAVGDSPTEVLAAAQKGGHRNATLYRVPDSNRLFFF
jgi:hypothetical protein